MRPLNAGNLLCIGVRAGAGGALVVGADRREGVISGGTGGALCELCSMGVVCFGSMDEGLCSHTML